MPILQFPKDFQAVRKLPFCYICGKEFVEDDIKSYDHVPPKNAFNAKDKEPPLKLKTHKSCNEKYSSDDKKMGHLIRLSRGDIPSTKALNIVHYPISNMAAVDNVNVAAQAWRWVKGFHAALYSKKFLGAKGNIEMPFPRAEKGNRNVKIVDIHPQHLAFVDTIKTNRANTNLDMIISNNQKMRYECVWCQFDNSNKWFCVFAIDIYGWKDLGSNTKEIPARGCAGFYSLPDYSVPENASKYKSGKLIIPNYDILDPFSP